MLQMLDDFVDVTKDEKQVMHLWNSFVRRQRYSCFLRLCPVFHYLQFFLNGFLFWYVNFSPFLSVGNYQFVENSGIFEISNGHSIWVCFNVRVYICAMCWQMLMFPGHVRHFQDFMDRSQSPLWLFSGTYAIILNFHNHVHKPLAVLLTVHRPQFMSQSMPGHASSTQHESCICQFKLLDICVDVSSNAYQFRCWRLFMIKLWNHGLLDACTMNSCNAILNECKNQESYAIRSYRSDSVLQH